MPTYAHWKGFEFNPQGCLLEQMIDLSRSMGIAYERSCEFYKDFHVHDRLMLVFPRASSAMEVRTQGNREKFHVDESSVLLVPRELEHDDEGVSSIYDTLALYPDDALIAKTAAARKTRPELLGEIATRCVQIPRSPWLSQLIQQYFYLRVVSRSDSDPSLPFFEDQIMLEVFALLEGKPSAAVAPFPESRAESVGIKALKYIEANLFKELELEEIAKVSAASVPTLLRHFKKETSQTPYSYIKNRRLEEALHLLKKGTHPVSEVALLVGYENLGAFSEAFKSKYKKSPSAFRGEGE